MEDMALSTDEWELSKENILPLKQGRSMANLTAALQHDEQKILIEQRSFEMELRTYAGDDPLDVWYRYILWAEQNFVKGEKVGAIRELLEKCTTTFFRNQRYVNDERYWNVWLKFMNQCSERLEVYSTLHSNGFFLELAPFYVCWAQEFENVGNYKNAEAMYVRGKNHNAIPKEFLENQLMQFSNRMAKRCTSNEPEEMEFQSYEEQRLPLIALKAKGKKKKVPNNRVDAQLKGVTAALGALRTTSTPSRNVLFQVLDENNQPQNMPLSQPNVPSSISIGKSARKENVMNPAKWAETKLLQRAKAPSTPCFQFHVDNAENQIFEQSKSTCQVDLTRAPLSEKKREQRSSSFVPPAQTQETTYKVMYCKDKVYNGLQEFQFEELRAARYFKKQKEKQETEQHMEEFVKTCLSKWQAEHSKKNFEQLQEIRQLLQQCNPLPQQQQAKVKNVMDELHRSYCAKETPQRHAEIAKEAIAILSDHTTRMNLTGGQGSANQSTSSFHGASPTAHTKEARMAMMGLFNKTLDIGSTSEGEVASRDNSYAMQPANNVAPSAPFTICKDETEKVPCFPHRATVKEEVDDEKENTPPKGLVQPAVVRSTRILQESEKVVVTQDSEDEDEEMDASVNDEFDDKNFVPENTMAFAKYVNQISTPFQNSDVKQKIVCSDDYTFCPQKGVRSDLYLAISQSSKFWSVELEDIPYVYSTGELSTNTTRGRVFKLSAITETSREYATSSSGSSSSGTTTLHQTTCSKSIFEFPEKIDPFDLNLREILLQRSNHNFQCQLLYQRTKLPCIKPQSPLTLGDSVYNIHASLGKGAYAKVFQAQLDYVGDESIAATQVHVLKVGKQSGIWELYITDTVHTRLIQLGLLPNVRPGILRFISGHLFNDGSILISDNIQRMTLLTFINALKSRNMEIPECIIMYIVIELLEVLHQLHQCQVIHADIKPDNILIMQSSFATKDLKSRFHNEIGGVMLIDFGRSIDMSLFPPETTFRYMVNTQDFTCPEMLDERPWTYQIDTFGLLSTVHCLLFSSYMKISKVGGVWKLNSTLKRYWQHELWKDFFHEFLNISSCKDQPDLKKWALRFQDTFHDSKLAKDFPYRCSQIIGAFR